MSGSTSSTSSTLTVAAPPTTDEVTAEFLTWIGAQNPILTDVNPGSQVRTMGEAIGSVVDMESVTAQAMALQALVYAAYAAFNVTPDPAIAGLTHLTFSTGTGASPPTAPANINIGIGTIVQTVGGIQFQTITAGVIPQGGTYVTVAAAAVVPGSAGNVAAGSISQILSSIPYTLVVTNALAATGGSNAEMPAQTFARFTAVVGSIGLGTPVGIANACIGVTASGSTEAVQYSTCYEPWIEQLLAGVTNPAAGFQVFVDNGSGTASTALLTAVAAELDGNFATGAEGNRPAGVPYTVNVVNPVTANVTVSGTAIQPGDAPAITSAVQAALTLYFTLPFGSPAQLNQIIAAVASAVQGQTSSLSIQMTDSSANVQTTISAGPTQRIIPGIITVSFS